MINITLEGRVPQAERLTTYANDVLQHFFKNRVRRDVDVVIEIHGNLYDQEAKEDVGGFCSGDRDEVTIEIARKTLNEETGKFELYTVEEIAQILAHELVHAKQYIRGELNEDCTKWKGIDHRDTKYAEQPWEVEAFNLEDELFETYWERG